MSVLETGGNAAGRAETELAEVTRIFALQRAAFLRNGPPSEATRRDRINRAIALLIENQEAIAAALDEDFSGRAREQTIILDVFAAVEQLKYCKRHMHRWMRPERRRTNFPGNLLGARTEIQYQPKGVVANICAWNFPIHIAFAPLGAMLAAGNHVIIKLSELTPRTAEFCQKIVQQVFDEREVAVVLGGPKVGAGLVSLPLDHILFTGSPKVGRLVLDAAAKNLVPVTLELGGKSPVIIGREGDLAFAAYRIAWAKLLNAGQICVSPDYALIPEDRIESFVGEFRHAVGRLFPKLRGNPDYTSMINSYHRDRVLAYLSECRRPGTQVIEFGDGADDVSSAGSRKIAPTIVIEPPDDSRIMQEEIFGPVLPIKGYRGIEDVVAYLNNRPRPLALYFFGGRAEADHLLSRTFSGGVAINDLVVQALEPNLPFGGIGESGMGYYHAEFGFKTFSHARAVYRGVRADPLAVLRPPYGKWTQRALRLLVRP